jgi:carboxyl-terminal processing protease
MKHASISCCVTLLFVIFPMAGFTDTETAPSNQPLFPIAAEQKISDPRETFETIRSLILQSYYTDAITEEDLYWAAIQGMLRHISPPQDPERAKLWSPEQYARIFNALKGVRISAGIKSTYNKADGSLTVTDVLSGSPADGVVQPLDRILRINGVKLLDKPVTEIDELLNGEPGTRIVLTLVRDIVLLDIPLTLTEFKANNVEIAMLPRKTGYALVKKISQDVSKELYAALAPLQESGLKKLIIDLRDNSGGVFNEGMKLAELFLENKETVLHTLQRGDRIQTFVSGNHSPMSFDLVIIVNKQTASSSEIFAGALQANQRARLVGTPTFGKATVEKTFTLENQFRVKFIVGAMYRPGGKSWQGNGLRPDFVVEEDAKRLAKIARLPIEDRLRNDRQLNAAWQLLQ